MPCFPTSASNSSGAKMAPGGLGDQVKRHAPPGEVPPQGERKRDPGVEVGAGNGAHEQDDRPDHQARHRHLRRQRHPAETRVDHCGADSHEDEEERPEELGEDAAPFVRVVEKAQRVAPRAREIPAAAEGKVGLDRDRSVLAQLRHR